MKPQDKRIRIIYLIIERFNVMAFSISSSSSMSSDESSKKNKWKRLLGLEFSAPMKFDMDGFSYRIPFILIQIEALKSS